MADPNAGPVPEADPAAVEAIRDELELGERVLWAAHTQRMGDSEGCPLAVAAPVLIGLYLVALVCYRIVVEGRFPQGEPVAVVLFVLSLAAGIFATFAMVAGTIASRRERRRPRDLLNVVTDRRVIARYPDVLAEERPLTVSVRPGECAAIERTDLPDGRGHLALVIPAARGLHSVRLENVPDVRGVEGLVRRTLLSDKVEQDRTTPPGGASSEVSER
jgi:hypothetical protein